MANERLFGTKVRIGLASPFHFADWEAGPTAAEMNAASTSDPSGSIWDLSCALDMENTTFDLGDSETDDELSFCQKAGAQNPTEYNPEIVYTAFRSTKPWIVSDPSSYDQANLAFSLIFARGVEYFAWVSIGKDPGEPFAIGDRVSLVKVASDFAVEENGSGENSKISQTWGFRSDIIWNHVITA